MKRVILHPFSFPLYIAFGDQDFPSFWQAMGSASDFTLNDASLSNALTYHCSVTRPHRLGVWFHEGVVKRPRDQVIKWMPGLIAHESLHVLNYLDEIIREDQKTGEIHAYLLQSIVDQIWREWLRERKTH